MKVFKQNTFKVKNFDISFQNVSLSSEKYFFFCFGEVYNFAFLSTDRNNISPNTFPRFW